MSNDDLQIIQTFWYELNFVFIYSTETEKLHIAQQVERFAIGMTFWYGQNSRILTHPLQINIFSATFPHCRKYVFACAVKPQDSTHLFFFIFFKK